LSLRIWQSSHHRSKWRQRFGSLCMVRQRIWLQSSSDSLVEVYCAST